VIARYDVKKIAFDRWNFKHLRPWLIKAGLDDKTVDEKFAEFGQGFQSMSPALRDLESAVLNQKIAHGNHPVLTMCALNAVVHRDPANNRKLVKHKSPGRIDGMIALAMAIGVVPMEMPPKSREYQMMFM
jgi:phage terminase large subunit-like protein